MTRRMSNGQCKLCGSTLSKSVMTKHLKSCKQKAQESEMPTPGRSSRKTDVFHLLVEDCDSSVYWMHFEIPASVRLEVLDSFLRQIWLECCGHMSAFTIDGKTYSVAPMADFDDENMKIRLDEVLNPGMKFFHEYDFGSPTHLVLKVISKEQKQIKGKSVRVLARNEPPLIPCISCGKIATQLCSECHWSSEGWLCNECAAEHQCDSDMFLPVVNSPRVGMCGYTG